MCSFAGEKQTASGKNGNDLQHFAAERRDHVYPSRVVARRHQRGDECGHDVQRATRARAATGHFIHAGRRTRCHPNRIKQRPQHCDTPVLPTRGGGGGGGGPEVAVVPRSVVEAVEEAFQLAADV